MIGKIRGLVTWDKLKLKDELMLMSAPVLLCLFRPHLFAPLNVYLSDRIFDYFHFKYLRIFFFLISVFSPLSPREKGKRQKGKSEGYRVPYFLFISGSYRTHRVAHFEGRFFYFRSLGKKSFIYM